MIWRNWIDVGGDVRGTPAVAGWTTRSVTVAARNQSGSMIVGWRDENGWVSSFQNIGLSGIDAPAVTSVAGMLCVFARGANNHLLVAGAMPVTDLGGDLRSSPAVAQWQLDGTAHVFVRGSDNAIWHCEWSPGRTPSWRQIGGHTFTAPAAVAWGPNRLDVFVRGSSLRLEHCAWDGTGWSAWEDLGGTLDSPPCAISRDIGTLDVFYGDDSGRLADRRFDGTAWLPARQLAAGVQTTPTAFSYGPRHVEVWHTSPPGTLTRLYSEGIHSEDVAALPSTLAGMFASAPSSVAFATTTIHCVARGGDDHLHHIAYEDGYWGTWRDLGSQLAGDPVAASPLPGALDVAFRDSAGWIFHQRMLNGTWGSAMNTGGATNDRMAVVVHNGQTRFMVRGTDERLYEGVVVADGSFSPWRDLGGVMKSHPHIAVVAKDALPMPAQLGASGSPAIRGGRYLCTLGTDGRTWSRYLGALDWEPWARFDDGTAMVPRPLHVTWPLGLSFSNSSASVGFASQAGWIGRTTTGQTQAHAKWWFRSVSPGFVSWGGLATMPWTTTTVNLTTDPVGLIFLEPPDVNATSTVVPTAWAFARIGSGTLVAAGFQQLAPARQGGWGGFGGTGQGDPAVYAIWERFEDAELLHVLTINSSGQLEVRRGGFLAEPTRVRPQPSPPPTVTIMPL